VVRWREEKELPPAALLIHSPYDVEARYGTKRSTCWVGYKVHLTETCDADMPDLITDVETTPATTNDMVVTPQVHTALAEKDLSPAQHLVDSGYMDADHLVTSQSTQQIDLVGPVSVDTHWQARAGTGLAHAAFTIDS
jgi:transposase